MKKPLEHKLGRQIGVRGMVYAPMNELGVVFLFGRLAPQLGFCIESIRPQFCDCMATRRGKRLRIEFEYWASAYASHRHDPKGADVVVCWEDDWAGRHPKYRHLEIVSLKKHAGAMPKIFAVGCVDSSAEDELTPARIEWNVPSGAQVGDLVLMYRSKPTSAICDAWVITGDFKNYEESNPGGYYPGLQAKMRRIARFSRPLTYADLLNDPATRDLAIVRKRFQGKTEITDYWYPFFKLLTKKNPQTTKALTPFLEV